MSDSFSKFKIPWCGARGFLTAAILLLATLSIYAVDPQEPPAPKPTDSSASQEFPNPDLAKIDRFAGIWDLVETQFDPRGQIISTVKGREENIWILDNHALRRTYSTKIDDKSYKAIGTVTWNDSEKKYRAAWFDNLSGSGPNLANGQWGDEANTFVWFLESPGKESPIRYRVIEQFLNEETRSATTYLVSGSDLIKRMEVRYTRALPCPGKIRVIDDMGTPSTPKASPPTRE